MSVQKIEELFVSIGLSVLILLVFLAAVLRFFGIDMSWSTDLAQLTFAWVCFIGADLALSLNKHMGVDMLVEIFSERKQLVIRLVNSILILVFLVFVFIYGVNLCIINRQRSFQTLPISYSFATASAPFGSALMTITVVKQISGYIKSLLKGTPREEA
ncbi:MAG: TRAP transporter small permease [Sphaerochaeta sp.]